MANNVIQDWRGDEDLDAARKNGQQDRASGRTIKDAHAVSMRKRILSGNGATDAEKREYVKGFTDEDNIQRTAETIVNRLRGDGEGMDSANRAPQIGENQRHGAPNNAFAYRISVAENLYSQMVSLANFIDHMKNDFGSLFLRHNLLVEEFFEEILENNIKPRAIQLSELEYEVRQYDATAVGVLIQGYQQAIMGMELGQHAAQQYFNEINLAQAHHLGGLAAALGNGDPRDYDTQLAIANSIRDMFEALLAQLDSAGRAYDSCAKEHDELMLQDFQALVQNNIEPRLDSFSSVWRNVQNLDITAIDGIIRRLTNLCH